MFKCSHKMWKISNAQKKNLLKDIFLHRAMPYVEKYLSINSRLRMSSLEVYISSISAPQML